MLKEIGIVIGVPLIRSVGGWLTKALEDGKITPFEWKQLTSTVVRVGIIGIAGYFSLNGFGVNISVFAAMMGAILADKLFGAIKEKV